jgi:hypothetical protein
MSCCICGDSENMNNLFSKNECSCKKRIKIHKNCLRTLILSSGGKCTYCKSYFKKPDDSDSESSSESESSPEAKLDSKINSNSNLNFKSESITKPIYTYPIYKKAEDIILNGVYKDNSHKLQSSYINNNLSRIEIKKSDCTMM